MYKKGSFFDTQEIRVNQINPNFTRRFCHSYVAIKHIYWMFPMGLKGQTALVRLFRVDVVMPPIRAGPSALSALLGRHHNIHPKHPNHSLIVLDIGKIKNKKKVPKYGNRTNNRNRTNDLATNQPPLYHWTTELNGN